MKILAIGGSGGMGRATVRAALTFDFISEITVAGIDKELGDAFVQSLNDKRVKNAFLDVNNTEQLRALISQCDVVLNSAGPFFKFGVPILSAAIEEGKHYCDICDDWQPTLEMLNLSEKAKEKKITAVIGLGASPGIINLLSVLAANTLDKVDTLVSAWKLSGAVNEDDGFGSNANSGQVDAAAVHLIHCISEKIRVVKEGKALEMDALEHSTINFPTLGELDVWSLGHPEAVTLPRYFTDLQHCYNGMLGIDEIVSDLKNVAYAVQEGKLTVEDAAALLAGDGGREARHAKLAKTDRDDVPGALAFAAGIKNGKQSTAGAFIKNRPQGGMATITGIPHAMFLPLLHHGHLKEYGVFSPEEVIKPEKFFEFFDPFCGGEGSGLTVLVS